ncbi:MAG TPA: LytTR family DNA-binding domain-containing protein [Bacteroidia bacterium]|nr:LytTR family DNA-binding domain-containing protein [Bacteroidia bacterium]
MKLRTLIVDDEVPARENLRLLLNEYCPEIEVVGLADSVQSAQKLIKELSPEVVFLDISMPSGTEGFDLLDSLPEKNFQIVFVTAYKDYALRAFHVNAIHYILKPIDIDDLKTAVKKLVTNQELFRNNKENLNSYIRSLENLTKSMNPDSPLQRITINHAKGFKIVDPSDIMYLEGEGNYTKIFFSDGTQYVDTRSLGIYEDILDPKKFFRIHKSHIVNVLCVSEFLNAEGSFVVMKNGARLVISRLRLAGFQELFRR